MSNKKYLLISFLITILGVPALIAFLTVFIGGFGFWLAEVLEVLSLHYSFFYFFSVLLILFLYISTAYIIGKKLKSKAPENFWIRYLSFIVPIFYVLILWLIAVAASGGDFSDETFWAIIGFGTIPFAVFLAGALLDGTAEFLPVAIIVSYLIFFFGFYWGIRKKEALSCQKERVIKREHIIVVAVFLLLIFACIAQGIDRRKNMFFGYDREAPSFSEEVRASDYALFGERSQQDDQQKRQLVTLPAPPSLRFLQDFPRLDGATALYPVYAAAARMIYQVNTEDDEKTVVCTSTNTKNAYERLIDGEVDIIFAAMPSQEHQRLAEEKGLTLTLTPFTKEAFVFFVNEQNPVTDLSLEQVRGIYSGKINNWKEAGGADEKIIPFQRPENSGSQTTMLKNVMKDMPIRKPLKEELMGDMGGIIHRVANYRNYTTAIGYSFRYYATQMNSVEGIRLLSINGIAPTVENIRSEVYPLTNYAYMVTARELSENSQKLHDWFLSAEGQQLVAEVGYVPYISFSRQ